MELFAGLVQGHSASHDVLVRAFGNDVWVVVVEFVVDFANYFFQDVFESHDSDDCAVFVDDECQQLVGRLKVFQQLADWHVLRNFVGRTHDGFPVEVVGDGKADQVFHVNDAEDFIQ